MQSVRKVLQVPGAARSEGHIQERLAGKGGKYLARTRDEFQHNR